MTPAEIRALASVWEPDQVVLGAIRARDVLGLLDRLDAAERDRDHADRCLAQLDSIAKGKQKRIEQLEAELVKRAEYVAGLEDDYSRVGQARQAAEREVAALREQVAHLTQLVNGGTP